MKYKLIKVLTASSLIILLASCGGDSSSSTGAVSCVLGTGTLDNCVLE